MTDNPLRATLEALTVYRYILPLDGETTPTRTHRPFDMVRRDEMLAALAASATDEPDHPEIDFWDKVYVRRGGPNDPPRYTEPTADEWRLLQRGSLAASATDEPRQEFNEYRCANCGMVLSASDTHYGEHGYSCRAASATEEPKGTLRAALDWPTLANVIREVDGNHDLGAGELAACILVHPQVRAAFAASATDEAGFCPDCGNVPGSQRWNRVHRPVPADVAALAASATDQTDDHSQHWQCSGCEHPRHDEEMSCAECSCTAASATQDTAQLDWRDSR